MKNKINVKSIFLLLAFLLSVGQMWATTWTVAGDNTKFINGASTWTPSQTADDMTNTSGTKWVLLKKGQALSTSDKKIEFKVCKDHGWGTAYPGDNYYLGDVSTNATYNIIYVFDTGNSNTVWAAYYTGWRVVGDADVFGSSWDTGSSANNMTKSSDYVYTITKKNVNLSAKTYEFKCITPEDGYKFNRPSDNKSFTISTAGRYDVTITLDLRDAASSSQGVSVTAVAATYNITLHDNNGGSNNGSAVATWKSTSLSSVSAPTRSNYHVEGYYTNSACTTKVATPAGALQASATYTDANSKWSSASNQTLYAKWEGDSWGITYKDEGNVSYSGSNSASLPSSYRYGTGVASLTDGVKSGYRFDGWFTTSACTGDPVTSISSSATGAKVFYAKWTENPGGTVTLTAGTGGQVSKNGSSWGASTSYTGIKNATPLNIYAQANTGYTFNTWTKTSGSGTITTNAASGVFTPVADADAALTASFTERMSSLSTSCHYDAGNPSYAAPTVSNSATNVGYVTTRTITATAAGTGYTFAGWTLTNCTRTDGGAATATQITIRSNGDGAAATVVANYEEDRTSRWHLVGQNDTGYEIFPDGWNASNTSMMQKASGHSTESVVYASVTVSSKKTYLFKIVDDNGASDDIWYGYSTGDTYLEWTNTSTKNVYSGDGNGNNLKFTPTLLGTYEFKVDYSGTYPAVTITYPEVYAVSGDFNGWTETSNLIFDGNVGTATISIDGNATAYEFKVLENGSWCGATLDITGNVSNQQLTVDGGDNITLNANVFPGGNYTFTYNKSTHKLSVSYPTSYTVESEVGTVKGNAHDPEIYHTSYTPANKIASGTKVAAGTMVKFVVASSVGSAAKAGYTWWGFYSNAAGITPTRYTDGSVTTHTINSIAANAHVYEIFGENNYTVKIYNNGNGDVYEGGSIVNATTAHVATASNTLTATPQTGYKFDSWDQFSDSLTINSPSTAATTIKIKDTKLGDNARLRANYSPQWSVLGSGAFGGWSAYDAHKFDNYAVVSTKDVGYNTITLAANTNYEIKVYDRQTGTWYGGTADQDIDYEHSGAGNEKTIATTSEGHSVFIQSAAGGSYTLNWNLTDKKIAVVYPTSWYITTGQKTTGQADDAGGSFTAVDNSSNNVKGGKFVANNANVTFTATPNTGYNFVGWYSDASCETAYVNGTGGAAISGEGGVVLTLSSISADKTVYAKFTPKNYTITLTRSGEGYSTGGDATATATFNATLPAVTLPTAANGYAFMGYYTGENGTGTQFMNASGTWATGVTDTIVDSKWKLDAGATLYAYFKKAEVTAITFSPAAVVEPNATITATPTIAPTPTGDHLVCWELQYSNGTPLASQPTFTPGASNSVSFTAPSASATYRLQAILRTGTSCSGGDILSTYVDRFQVAGEHDVTVLYKDASGNTIKTSEVIEGVKPLVWSSDITAPTITGYTFARWDAGDGVSIKNGESDPVVTSTDATINIKANYDGTLTAVYNKKRMIYFYNTLNWGSVYVYFYKNDSYWQTVSPYNGSGANTSYTWTSTPYSEGLHGQMLPISEGSNIYYFDAEAAGVNASYDDVVFTEHQQHGYDYFYETNAVRRGDYKTSMPMFVPLADQEADVHNKTNYYNNGYWINYPENTGYTLKIYNNAYATKETAAVQSIAFPYSEDLKMPIKMDVELTDGSNHDYWFMVYRNDGTYMGSAYHFKQGYQNEQTITGGENKNKITTSAPGNYTFILTYHGDDSNPINYNFYIDVDFPIATGDYRIYYSDNATWSKAAHTKDSWYHPSHSIAKATTEAKKDTVSFYIPKGEGISHTMKFQKVSVTNEGVVTWSDVAGGSITIPSSITESGVYNFIVSQPAGGASISLEKAEPYTGNYYIRTDCAGNTKWDSYKNVDHQMTYSDYSATNKGFTHYYAHWAESGTNVKFTIANDYSLCVTDTLEGDTYTDDAQTLPAGANVRFMWKQSTNKISRAYISGSSVISDRFLVLEGDSKMFAENGDPLTDAGGGKISGLNDNEVNLVDDQNFIYERSIQVQTTARARLSAKYNNKVQYFIGNDSGDTWAAKTEELLGGESSATKHTMRIVYDFKTDRLVKAYVPAANLEDNIAINADIMLVREHQEEGQQLTFNGGSLSEVLTVYGVMRFNRWTLNNKEKTGSHAVVGDPKSSYERGMYWISFPFDVNLSDVFGFGTYGVDWIIEEYQGDKRATDGYWADSEGFWEFVMNRTNYVLEAGKGYVLALDLDRMKDNNTDFWTNNIEQVELYFPSATNVSSISATNVRTTVPSHECTIDRRTDKTSPDINKDRTIADSHWNLIGIPSYANYGSTLTSDGSTVVTWNNPASQNLPYLYEWNMTDNSYTPQTGTTYPFKSMHGYMVQYHGYLYWTLASATPASPVVARRTYAEKPQNVELRLEIQQNEKMVDQTFVKLSNDEEVSAAFKFDEDLCKEFNRNKANIYTMIENYLPAAGNTMPLSEQTTVIPVGVKITTNGDYTFAIPAGTEGIGVTLIDNETGVRTSLSALDYTVNLSAGTYNERFLLEISPVQQTPTDLETVSDEGLEVSGARKVMIDQILYIVKDGKVYDARGARVE